MVCVFFFASRRRHTRCALVTGVQTCALPICLRGEEMRELLEACGALRYPRPEKAPNEPHWSDRLKALRLQAGHAETSGYSDNVEDWMLQGFQDLLDHLPKLTPEQRDRKSVV